MAISFVGTRDERLVCGHVVSSLREALEARGAALLLVPSFPEATEAQRVLAGVEGLGVGVDANTPGAWVRKAWETWGDGRTIADGSVLSVLAHEAIRNATDAERGPITLLPGMVSVLANLVRRALPWLPLDESGAPDLGRCERQGLTGGETCFVRLAGAVGRLLDEYGLIAPAEASACVVRQMTEAGARLPGVVMRGFTSMPRAERELVRALGSASDLVMVSTVVEGPAMRQAAALVEQLGGSAEFVAGAKDVTVGVERDRRLQDLVDVLFGDGVVPTTDAPVELLLPAGPVAEAELVAERVVELLEEDPRLRIVVTVPDVRRAWRELMPKLEERHVSARTEWTQPLSENASAQAFQGFAATVARLSELARTWPDPEEGLEGPVPRLGDMDWWPPRELIDFLFEDMAHTDSSQAWRLDAQWRGNRLLTPARTLEMLQSERYVSAPVARSTFELLRGRIGSAVAKLLAAYGVPGMPRQGQAEAESSAVLLALLKTARALRTLRIRFDPTSPDERSLSEVVSLLWWATGGVQVGSRLGVGPNALRPQVLVLEPAQAARLGAGSVDVLIACGQTSAESPVEGKQGVLQAMLEMLGVEPQEDSLARARSDFRALVGIARRRVIFERAQNDADGKANYPSVMLSELLAALGTPTGVSSPERMLCVRHLSERVITRNLGRSGKDAHTIVESIPAPAGRLTQTARGLVFVPQPGKPAMPEGLPVLSASQVETYLDCPYKWFSLRRLRLSGCDAGFGAVEMGSFAHRVLEVTHTELLLRALERTRTDLSELAGASYEKRREALLAAVAADPARHIEGSRVSAANLDEACAALELEFDLHREHMYRTNSPKAAQQLLIAHDSKERAQERQLRLDLLSSLSYQTRILEGFEPRFFEWSFGRRTALVKYAGAYFMGTVNRIDVSPHGTAVIIDYKHKSPIGFAAEYDALSKGVLEGTALPARVQSLIYAQVVRRAFEGRLRLVGSVYLSTRSPHALAGVADENVADLVFGRISRDREERVCVPAAEDGGSGMEDLLDLTEELIAEKVRQMLAGNVEANPRDRRSCDFCPVMQCERRVAR